MPHVLYRSGESTPRTTVVLPTPQHYPFLFELALSSGSSFSWRGRRQTMSAFEDVLWEGVYEHAVILDRVSSEPIGYASIGNVNLLHGTAYLSVYVSTELRLRGTPLEGVALLLTRLFERTDLRKVYLESPESAHASFRSSELFEVEAVLEEHLRSGSGFEDLIISSLTRERCDQYLGTLFRAWVSRDYTILEEAYIDGVQEYDADAKHFPPVIVRAAPQRSESEETG